MEYRPSHRSSSGSSNSGVGSNHEDGRRNPDKISMTRRLKDKLFGGRGRRKSNNRDADVAYKSGVGRVQRRASLSDLPSNLRLVQEGRKSIGSQRNFDVSYNNPDAFAPLAGSSGRRRLSPRRSHDSENSEALSVDSSHSGVSSTPSFNSSGGGSHQRRSRSKKRTSVMGRIRRISVGQTVGGKHVSVYFDGREFGRMSIRPQTTTAVIRKYLDQDIPRLKGEEFYFWYSEAEARFVEEEDEEKTLISACLDDSNMLCIASKGFMMHNEDTANNDMQLNDDELRDLDPQAETVIRCCFRLLENVIFEARESNMPTTASTLTSLPSLAKSCIRFIKQVVRATIDSRSTSEKAGSPEIKWYNVEQFLHQLEDHLVVSSSRRQFAEWWYYRMDQKVLVDIVGALQREFRRSPNLESDHPVFFFRQQKAGTEVESLLDALNKSKLIAFSGRKYDDEREKLAQYLDIDEKALRYELLTKKEGILTDDSEDGALFRPRNLVKETSSGIKDKISQAQMKETLAPLFDSQEATIERDANDFCSGTREWAFERFDEWVANYHTSHRACVFTGPAGSGKSCFVSKLVRARPHQVLAYHFCRHDESHLRDPKVMLLSLVYQLSLQSPHYASRVREILTKNVYTRRQLLSSDCSVQMIFSDLLAAPLFEIQVPVGDRFVIVVDGIDEAKQGLAGENELLDAIRGMFHRLPGWVLFLFTTKPRLPILKKLRKFNALMISAKGDQDDNDFKVYFKSVFARDMADDARFNEELSNILAYNAGESFLFCKLMYTRLKSCQKQGMFTDLSMLKLEQLLRREYADVKPERVELFWDIVKLCMVSIKPLQIEVLKDLLSCKREDLIDVLENSPTFFVVDAQVVRFVHKIAKDWLLNQMGNLQECAIKSSRLSPNGSSSSLQNLPRQESTVSEVSACHQFFGRRVKKIMIDNELRSDQAAMTCEYLLQHGVHHLALGRMLNDAKELILSPAWLVSHANDLDSIVDACDLLSNADQLLALLARAVSLSGEAAKTDPRQLIGQLVGRLVALTFEGHGNLFVRERMAGFLHDLRSYDYGFQWWCPLGPTWDQAEQPYIRSLVGHSAPIQTVAWHSNGRQCASGCWDGDIRVWDTLTGHCGHTLCGHTNSVWAVDWEPKGSRLASGSLDHTIRIWDIEADSCVSVLEGHAGCVWDVSWSHDGKAIASGSKDMTIRIWDVGTALCTKVLSGTEGLIYSVSWEGGMKSRLCSGSTDNCVRVWDTQTATCVAKLEGHKDWVRSVDWCRTGRHIVSASADSTVRVWDAETFECEHVLMGHSDTVWSVAKSQDGRHAVSASSDRTVRVWDCTTGRPEQVLDNHKGAVWSVAFSPDSKRLISGSADHNLIVWDASVGMKAETLPGHVQPIWCIDVSRDGSKIVSGSADKTARLWNTNSGLCEKVFSGHTGPLFAIKFSMDGKSLASASSDNTAAVYRISTGDRKLQLLGHTASVWCVAWATDDSVVYTGSKDMTIRAWDTDTGKCNTVLSGHTKDVKGISVCLDGKRLASASSDASIRIWAIETSACERVLSRQDTGCLCLSWHPDNHNLLVAGYTSGSVCVWDTHTGEREIDFFPGHARRTNAVSWSPDGQRIVSASSDKEVRIWSMDSKQCQKKIKASTVGLFGVTWKGRYIISCGADKSIQLFNPDNGRCESVMAGENRNSLGILDMAMSKDGKYAVTGSRQRVVQIWNADTGSCEKTLSGHTNWVHSVVFDEAGERVLSRSDDGTSRLWDVNTGECLMVNEDADMTPTGFIARTKTATRSLSGIAQEGQPVGVLCGKARVEGQKACGWIGKKVYFFHLMGEISRESSPAAVEALSSARE